MNLKKIGDLASIPTYTKKLEDEKARLRELASTNGITAEMVLESMTPAERTLLNQFGGEVMLRGLFAEIGCAETNGDAAG